MKISEALPIAVENNDGVLAYRCYSALITRGYNPDKVYVHARKLTGVSKNTWDNLIRFGSIMDERTGKSKKSA